VLGALILIISLRAWVNASLATFIPLLGQARGRWGRDRIIVGSLLLSVPFGLLVALRPAADPGFFAAAVWCGFFLNASFVVLMIRGQESVPGSVGMVTGITLGLTVGLGGLAVTPMAVLGEWVGLPWAAAVAASGAVVAAAAMRLLPPLPARGAD
jgi:FSR family fosmidomycin resistance protein-like MFS transporter